MFLRFVPMPPVHGASGTSPKALNYLLKRASRRNVTGVKGQAAKTAAKENRNQFSVDAAIGFDQYFKDQGLDRDLEAPHLEITIFF